MDSFWDFLWLLIVGFAFVAYLMVMFSIIGDLFRDHKTSGFVKALWVLFLIVAPFLTALVYLIVNGSNMAKRQVAALQHAQDQQGGVHQARRRSICVRRDRTRKGVAGQRNHRSGRVHDAEGQSAVLNVASAPNASSTAAIAGSRRASVLVASS